MVVGIAAGARLMDRWLPDPEESLGFLVLARPKGFSRGAERAGSSASPVAAALPAR
jgi:hypothetical protein